MSPVVVLFDRDCGFCQATVRWLRRRDRRRHLEFVALQEAADSPRAFLRHVAATHPLHDEVHVVDEATAQVTAGGRAMLTILGLLPGGFVFRTLGAFPPVAWIADLVYGVVARNRDTIGRWLGLESFCRVPPAS